MRLDLPLEQHVRRRGEPVQLEFAARARSILGACDDCLLAASERGLTLLGRNEEAIAMPRQVLQDAFGEQIEIDPIRVRLVPGTPPREPIMHARVDAPLQLLPPVRWALQRRRVVLLEEDAARTRVVVRGEGQAARLLGLGNELSRLGGAAVLLWVALSRYAPIGPELDGAGDGNRTHV